MLIHAIRAGVHIDKRGKEVELTRADIHRIAHQYNEQIGTHEAPIVIGHPEENAPAYGWIKRFVADGDDLHAVADQLDPDFLESVKAGRYKKTSISLYPDGTVRHIGFLGAVPPAVKGLNPVQFAEGEESTIEFEEGSAEPPTLNEGEGMEEQLKQILELLTKLVAEKEKPAGEQKPVEESKPAAEQKPAEEFSEREKFLATELQKMKDKQFDSEFREFLNSDDMKGRVGKGEEPKILKTARILAGAGTADFGEGTGEKSALEVYKETLLGRAVRVEFSELATGQTGQPAKSEVDALVERIAGSRK